MIEPYTCPEWTLDCQGKQDMDGPIIHLSTRYYPGRYQQNGKVSTSVAIYAYENAIAGAEFEADTEAQVKAMTEAWAKSWADRIIGAALREVALATKSNFTEGVDKEANLGAK